MRRTNDWYPTPEWATEVMLKHIPIHGIVFEPCSGDGAIAKPLLRAGCTVLTNDLDRKWPANTHEDARDQRVWKGCHGLDWVVTNPPFNVADQILPFACQHAKAVAMLLRLSYLEPCEGRSAWLAEYPPDQLIVLPRISFTGDGKTDSVTCAWMIWAPITWGRSIVVIPPVTEGQPSLLEQPA